MHAPNFECGQWTSYVWPTTMSTQCSQLYGVVNFESVASYQRHW